MSYLVVFAFRDPDGAAQMRDTLAELQTRRLISLQDAAIVVRRQDGKVNVRQAVNLVGEGALGGVFWGMFIGLLFWMPWLGVSYDAQSSALAAAFGDVGIDRRFSTRVGHAIEPGQSALFLLVRDWTEDKVMEELVKFDAQVLQTSLTNEEEARLRTTFGAEE